MSFASKVDQINRQLTPVFSISILFLHSWVVSLGSLIQNHVSVASLNDGYFSYAFHLYFIWRSCADYCLLYLRFDWHVFCHCLSSIHCSSSVGGGTHVDSFWSSSRSPSRFFIQHYVRYHLTNIYNFIVTKDLLSSFLALFLLSQVGIWGGGGC